jgi:nucleotide-binding universal stress UspA family protein
MKTILVAIDGSPRSELVIDVAVATALKMGAKVRLLHVLPIPPELPLNAWGVSFERSSEQLLEMGRRVVDSFAKAVPPAVLAGKHAEIGVPWRSICESAKEHDDELVAVGAHGYGLVERVLGTTSSKIVNHADRPVLVVRPKGERS